MELLYDSYVPNKVALWPEIGSRLTKKMSDCWSLNKLKLNSLIRNLQYLKPYLQNRKKIIFTKKQQATCASQTLKHLISSFFNIAKQSFNA